MTIRLLFTALLCVAPLLIVCSPQGDQSNDNSRTTPRRAPKAVEATTTEDAANVHYLEIVTPEVQATCEALEELQGVSFAQPVTELGNARTAPLAGGGRIGVRPPMRDTEAPVVRPYILVDDIEAAVAAAQAAGAQIAMPPTEIPGQGTFAIYILGGIDHGLWEK